MAIQFKDRVDNKEAYHRELVDKIIAFCSVSQDLYISWQKEGIHIDLRRIFKRKNSWRGDKHAHARWNDVGRDQIFRWRETNGF